MGLFGDKKETKKEKTGARAVKKPKAVIATAPRAATKVASVSNVLVRPHITEKAAQATARGVYTFDIRPDATKETVAAAIESVYRVKPVKVGIVKTPGARVRLRTRRGYGRRSDAKKAYVYLKKGDRIEFAS